MGLEGKLVSQISVKCDGDVIHEIFRERPHHIPSMASKVQKVSLREGQWGKVGSVICWDYIHEGKVKASTDLVEAIDDKSVTLKVIEGHMMQFYKSFKLIVHVDKRGEDSLVTWTFEYEKLNENVPDPHPVMELCLNIIKDIEIYHLSSIPN